MRNEDVLVVLNIDTKELVTIIMNRKTMYFGHLLKIPVIRRKSGRAEGQR